MTDLELAEKHRYVVAPGGKPEPGVTSVAGILSKDALQWASARLTAEVSALEILTAEDRARVTAEHYVRLRSTGYGRKKLAELPDDLAVYIDWLRTEFRRRWDAKADLGTRIHDHAIAWAAGRSIEAHPDEHGCLDALERFYEENEPKWLHVERIIGHPMPDEDPSLAFGGRFDGIPLLCAGRHKGRTVMLDWKTGGHYAEPVALQIAAYTGALGMVVYDGAGMVSGYEPLPEIDGGLVVYLRPDGTYEAVDPFDGIPRQESWRTFLGLRSALNFRRRVEAIDRKAKKEHS